MTEYTNIIAADDLAAILPQCTVLDCRSQLGDVDWGRQQYEKGHIKGAIYAHLDSDLADPPNEHGRHPLPSRERFLGCIQKWGITNDRQVVCYDDAGGAYAARAWWMLRWMGHARVAVLDGGLSTWQGDLERGAGELPLATTFTPSEPLTRLIEVDTLMQQLKSPAPPTLVDARARPRWAGEQEPIDPVAGHIPGAHCYPFQDNLDDSGRFKPAAELRARFNAPGATVVCYCGSGVTAAHNMLAMHIAGLPEPVLYADSWSGWITDPARPIETAG
jgi:thiosulfate/3-mercaptopyruvate sulfurtransferase